MRDAIYQRLKRWAQSKCDFTGRCYTWRHSLMMLLSHRYAREYDAALEAALLRAFAGCDAGQITAGKIDCIRGDQITWQV